MGFRRPHRLTQQHDTGQFDCGDDATSDWLRKFAFASDRAGLSSVYVATELETMRVAGYYALATGAVATADAAERVAKGAGRHDIPVILLARLGVERRFQGLGLGRALLKDALLRTLNVGEQVAVRALLVHALDESARAFYMNFAEFEASPTDLLHLLLLLKDAKKALAGGR
ncbi:MAG: GNAT family N-acetyltransferase [Bifidobacteriaceae bacterium]|jgi:GNAT superfamily N-acetyltransferase|nr:GNAT family N-acetyltransferase [Bifidobacteriaceae bacterium]